MDRDLRESEDASWVETYRPVVEHAFHTFTESGAWTPIQTVQRELDREGLQINVQRALEAMPRLEAEMRAYQPTDVRIPMRLLWHLPESHELLGVALEIIRRARTLYYTKGVEHLVIASDDEALLAAVGDRAPLLDRAVQLVTSDYPNPLNGGSLGDERWEFQVNEATARELSGVETLPDYFDRQASIMEEAQRPGLGAFAATPEAPVAEQLFVLMPFSEEWAADVYELIREAGKLADPELRVYRADDITISDYITHQIMQAIRDADAVLAVVTGFNPNVMWELGFAYALEKPLVMLNANVADAPFDVRTFRQVTYSNPATDEEKKHIAAHILGALGRDPQ